MRTGAQNDAADTFDRNALVAFSTGNDPFTELGSWVASSDPCSVSNSWLGVSCDGGLVGMERRATALRLVGMGVAGDIGDLAAMVELQVLDLHGSHAVHGSVENLRALTELRLLDLSHTVSQTLKPSS